MADMLYEQLNHKQHYIHPLTHFIGIFSHLYILHIHTILAPHTSHHTTPKNPYHIFPTTQNDDNDPHPSPGPFWVTASTTIGAAGVLDDDRNGHLVNFG